MEYSEKEMNIICDACCSTFILVASSDNDIHTKEEEYFLQNYQSVLQNLKIVSDPKEIAVLEFWANERFTHEHISDLIVQPKPVHIENILTSVQLVETKEHAHVLHHYKKSLLDLGSNIAKSAHAFWGLGPQVSENEHQILNELSRCLDIPLS